MNKVYSVKDGVKIKNANGTGNRKCKCDSWLAHWEKYTKKTALTCCVKGCNAKATVGAHTTRPIAKNEDYKTHPYILPMCSSHNGKHGQELYSKGNVSFVWANVSQTCGS
ncbi:hypothetical protein AB6D92_15305 [Vibrio splendidus]